MSLHRDRSWGWNWRRVLIGMVALIALLAAAGLVLIEVRWTRRFEAPYPAIAARADAADVARGRYLVYGAAACAYCHVPRDQWGRLDKGEHLALTGHHLFRLPFGDIYSANLTPVPDRHRQAIGCRGRAHSALRRSCRRTCSVSADGVSTE